MPSAETSFATDYADYLVSKGVTEGIKVDQWRIAFNDDGMQLQGNNGLLVADFIDFLNDKPATMKIQFRLVGEYRITGYDRQPLEDQDETQVGQIVRVNFNPIFRTHTRSGERYPSFHYLISRKITIDGIPECESQHRYLLEKIGGRPWGRPTIRDEIANTKGRK